MSEKLQLEIGNPSHAGVGADGQEVAAGVAASGTTEAAAEVENDEIEEVAPDEGSTAKMTLPPAPTDHEEGKEEGLREDDSEIEDID